MTLALELRATPAELARSAGALRAWSAEQALPQPLIHDLALILDEVLANVAMHGYRGDPAGWIGLRVEREGSVLRLEVRDRAPEFDPRQARAPDLSVPLDQRPIGGLGLHLVQTLADEVSYARVGDENHLTLTLRVGPEVGPQPGR